MALRQYKSRIHLLAAKDAPRMVVLQRKRDKLFHVITINTQTLRITEGSWFRGKLYPLRCDVSFDGTFMVYLAMGASGKTWNGVCRLPWLTTLTDVENTGTWYGGGFFAGRRLLKTNGWGPHEAIANRANIPFRLEAHASRYGGEDLGVIYERFECDGFKRLGEAWGEQRTLGGNTYRVACDGDDAGADGHRGSIPSSRCASSAIWSTDTRLRSRSTSIRACSTAHAGRPGTRTASCG